MKTRVLSNLGNGPVTSDVCLNHAITNVAAFVEELAMRDPPAAVTMRSPEHDGTGRYQFDLHRGIRTVDVDMPGVSLDEIRCTKECPRLCVDGNSWWWRYALDIARTALENHDGAVEQRIKASEQAAEFELDRQPQCSTCNSVRSLVTARAHLYEVRCYTCDPEIETWRETSWGVTYHDDSWKRATHYLVKRQHLSPEVPGHENPMHSDALCGARLSIGSCRLRRRHGGRCEPYWKVERTLVVPDLEVTDLTRFVTVAMDPGELS